MSGGAMTGTWEASETWCAECQEWYMGAACPWCRDPEAVYTCGVCCQEVRDREAFGDDEGVLCRACATLAGMV